MSELVIRVNGLSKRYAVAALRNRQDTLRDELVEGVKRLFRRGPRTSEEEFWALRDVSFNVNQGDVLGLIGRNGAGKSTLLKVLARITEPTSGSAEIRGRIGSLLEVGTGFDRELTGRENVYLSGAIIGMRRKEIRRKFDEIVAFAEVERFIETPVKRYSSGMFLRLAFAVAAHLETEILLLDEVLAVGDANFQRRCLGKMRDVASAGRTIVFVSHNLAAITRFCRTCMWLEQGKLREFGGSEDVVGKYLTSGLQDVGEITFAEGASAPGSEFVRLVAVRIRNQAGDITSAPDGRYPFSLEVEYRILRHAKGIRVGATLFASDGTAVLSSIDLDCLPEDFERAPGRYVSRCNFPGDFLNLGHYFLSVGSDTPLQQSHFFVDRALSLRLEHPGGVGGHMADGRLGLLRMQLPWDIQKVHEADAIKTGA